MVKLEGFDAAVLHVAKGELNNLNGTLMERLKCAIAATAGLTSRDGIGFWQVLQAVAQTHDSLTEAGLIKRPAVKMLDSLRLWNSCAAEGVKTSPSEAFLQMLMTSMTCMQMADGNVQFVEWKSGLVPQFNERVRQLSAIKSCLA